VDGVGPAVTRLLGQLLRLNHLLDPGAPWIGGHIEDVDPRRAEPGHDQVRAVGPVAGRAAAVPAEVVELVADTRHRRLVNDLAVAAAVGIGADHRDEVRLVDAGALVQTGQIEEPLARRLERLDGRGVEGPRALVAGVGAVSHACSPLMASLGGYLDLPY
jgi:hypothetical protein